MNEEEYISIQQEENVCRERQTAQAKLSAHNPPSSRFISDFKTLSNDPLRKV